MPSLISLLVNFCSVIMASRRSKDKTPATANSIVKKELVSSLDIVNRFTPLGTIPKPNYSSVLASSYDPYALTTVNYLLKLFMPRFPILHSMLKNNLSIICFLLSQIGLPSLIHFHLLLVTFPQDSIGSLNMVKKLCNITLIFCAMKTQSLLKPSLIRSTLPR